MRILLTNDDGYDAPGLGAAFAALRELGEVYVVAPKTERSACSHTITLRRPITVERFALDGLGEAIAVGGAPADCVRLAVAELIDPPVDLVVAGINRGANAGIDTYYSGTVAAAREAAALGLRAIAVSQAIRKDIDIDWAAARDITAELVSELSNESLPGPGFWNVNLPAPIPPDARSRVRRVPLATHPIPMGFERKKGDDGRPVFVHRSAYWIRDVATPTDYSTVRDGDIAVTPIPLFGRFE
ncbi:MAG: 5'/3'-nucleotidase SurE [Phycisphaerae bacterium]|jgi:5'-nucleotidase